MAHVSLRTIRFYDQKNLLKPSYVKPSGARFYTKEDFRQLQQILLLKYLGFSLDDIREMTIENSDQEMFRNALHLQKRLVQDRIEQMQMVADSIDTMTQVLDKEEEVDWSQMLELIHLTAMENSLKNQYQNASNISARIRLHQKYSKNHQGWFPWILQQCDLKEGMRLLELGCGNGELWMKRDSLPQSLKVVLTDISEGMIRDVRRTIGNQDERFSFETMDAHQISYPENTFDIVIANHVLFYCEDIRQVCQEIYRVLKPQGLFVCSTYSGRHMREITELVQEFDSRIVLSSERLYERFGLDNGEDILRETFSDIEKRVYEDDIEIDRADPLVEYILSCHGNQNQYLLERYSEFKNFLEKKTESGLRITKDAGIFLCKKSLYHCI